PDRWARSMTARTVPANGRIFLQRRPTVTLRRRRAATRLKAVTQFAGESSSWFDHAPIVRFVFHIVDRRRSRAWRDVVHADARRRFRRADHRRLDCLAEEWIGRYRSLCARDYCAQRRTADRNGR